MGGPVVGIVGGGFTGAALVAHLAPVLPAGGGIVVVEPRERLGAGVAYGDCEPEHRINVPSDRMEVFPEDPTHFTRWLLDTGRHGRDTAALTPLGHHYSRRADFGDYMGWLVEQAARTVAVRHRRARAVGLAPDGDGWRLETDAGPLACDAVVVTASHAAPTWPWPIDSGLQGNPGIVPDPWRVSALEGVPADASVVIAGTGLTMCDTLVSLRQHGHRGPILALSRRALLPRPQDGFPEAFDLLDAQPLPATARALLRLVRRGVTRADAQGLGWKAALDATRRELPRLWGSLGVQEQARALRHLRPWWDVHRFRMAPQVHALVAEGLASGWLALARGRVRRVVANDAGRPLVVWTSPAGGEHQAPADLIVNCIGPDSDLSRSGNRFFRSIIDAGLARPDALRLGLETDRLGRVRHRDGPWHARLRAAGPLARAAVGEVTGVPEASRHAREVAHDLAACLMSSPACA